MSSRRSPVAVAFLFSAIAALVIAPLAAQAHPPQMLPVIPSLREVAATYLRLGIEHIATGIDHLAFVLGLVLLAPAWRKVWKSITAFTAAHSLTLALATVGTLRLPAPPVEAAIALSIVFVAREAWLVAQGRPGATAARPWPVAFTFGLLHGLGFAGALAQVGLPVHAVPLALLTFNLGVEIGQLAFVAVVLMVGRPLSRALSRLPSRIPLNDRPLVRLLPAYAIGTLATFWTIERLAAFWS